MTLQSKSFLVYKGDTLESIAQFLSQEIGLNAYLVKAIKGVSLSETVTQLTVLYEKYAPDVLDSVAPREGAIFTTGVASNDFDLRFLFNDPVDFRSLQSGSFSIDGVGLETGRVYLDPNANNYFLKVSASGTNFQTDAFHTYQMSTSLKRLDGSTVSYTPVGGYVFHTLSNAHIGDYTDDYMSRRRGTVSVAVVRISKGINPQQGIVEFLSQRQLSNDRLISYTPISASTNHVDVYFMYIDRLEPQITSGFPLNNSLLPEISAPGKVTFVFNTPLDKAKLSSTTGLFTIEEDFSTSTEVPPADVTLLDDLQTVEIDTSSYFSAQKIYSILARPGILGLDGLVKEKPEQWTIHIASYEGSVATGELTGVSQAQFDALEALFTGHTGDPTIHYTQAEIDIGTGQINDLPPLVTQQQFNSLSGSYTGHTGETNIHYEQSEISHTNIQDIGTNTHAQIDTHIATTGTHFEVTSISHNVILDRGVNSHGAIDSHLMSIGNPHMVTLAQVGGASETGFTGHTGDTTIHFTEGSISHTNIQDIGTNTHAQIDTHIASTSNPHSVTTTQIGAATLGQFTDLSGDYTGHTGETGIHYSMNDITVSVDQVNSQSATNGYVMTADGAGGASWTEVAGGGGDVTQAEYDYLSGEHSGLNTAFTGHTGDTTIHFTTGDISHTKINDIGTYTHTQIDSHIDNTSNPHGVTPAQIGALSDADLVGLSGDFTGHTGDTSIHFDTLDGLSDVIIDNMSDNQVLFASKGNWYNTGVGDFIGLTDLEDVTLSSPSEGEVLTYTAGVWANNAAGGGGATTLTGLNDITLTQEYAGAVIGWNTDSGAWTDMWVTGSNGITVVDVPSINALFIVGNDPLASASNLSDVTDVDIARKNLKCRYFVEDILTYDFLNSSDNHNVGSSYLFSQNNRGYMTGGDVQGVMTASNGNDSSYSGSASRRMMGGASLDLNSSEVYYFRMAIDTTTNIHARFGLSQSTFNSESDITHGAYFEYVSSDGPNWKACTAASSSRTKTDCGIAAVEDEWKWFGIQGADSGVYFYDADFPINSVEDCALFIGTNRPTQANSEMRVFINCISFGATYRHVLIDKFAYPIYDSALPSGMPAAQILS